MSLLLQTHDRFVKVPGVPDMNLIISVSSNPVITAGVNCHSTGGSAEGGGHGLAAESGVVESHVLTIHTSSQHRAGHQPGQAAAAVGQPELNN